MMIQRIMKFLRLSVCGVAVSSLSLMCIPICGMLSGTIGKVVAVIVAGVFWLGLIFGQLCYWKANDGRKKLQEKSGKGKRLEKPRIGLLVFATSREAKVCDIVFLASLVCSVVFYVLRVRNDLLILLGLAVLYFSLHLHCILNGKTYRMVRAFHLAKKRVENK